MHHLYPSVKGDPICPLGFHPQVRWPTRCKRCLRDYKDHGGRKKLEEQKLKKDDAVTSSTPSLLGWGTPSRTDDSTSSNKLSASSIDISNESKTNSYRNSNLHSSSDTPETTTSFLLRRPASWTSTPDLGKLQDNSSGTSVPTVSLTLPRRRLSATTTSPTDSSSNSKPTSSSSSLSSLSSSSSSPSSSHSTTDKTSKEEEPAKTTVKKEKLTSTRERVHQKLSDTSKTDKDNAARRIKVKELKAAVEEPTNHDVQFLIQVKAKSLDSKTSDSSDERHTDDDVSSITGTETTDTTIIDRHEHDLQEQINSLQKELDTVKQRCEKAEREKSDILLKRLASREITSSRTTASEALKLQQKCNEFHSQLEDLKDDKKYLTLKVKELEAEINTRPSPVLVTKITDELKSKLLAAETLCEELMDENEDMKKELRNMEEEMEEMQDNFREDQADEYTSLKKELEQTTKNCRILSFKLRKTERKMEQLELDKQEAQKKLKVVSDGQSILDKIERIEQLEQELRRSNEVSVRLQKELEESKTKKTTDGTKTVVKKKAPMLSSIKTDKMSRESLTRGGSQDDPIQLMRDLQDSLEREADLREQLKFAEEEAQSLRKKASRVEDDNESLVLQLKKMASQAKTRKASPAPRKLSTEEEKDEGISADEDPNELRLLLELSEQEASVLRRKIEEMDKDADIMRRKMKDLQDKLNTKAVVSKTTINGSLTKSSSIEEQKVKVLEDETHDLRKKLVEKERDCERLYAELSVTQKRSKGIQKSKSLDLDQQTVDLKRQLEVTEQEAIVLRSKLQSLEAENEKLSAENKSLTLLKGAKKLMKEKSLSLEKIDEKTGMKMKSIENLSNLQSGYSKVKDTFDRLREHIEKSRTPKRPTDLTPRNLLKTWVNDLEEEISQYSSLAQNIDKARKVLEDELKTGPTDNISAFNDKLKLDSSQRLEDENNKLKNENKSLKEEKDELKQQVENLNTLYEETKKKQTAMQKSASDSVQKNEEINTLKKNLDQLKQVESEKNSLDKQINEKTNKITELETRIKEADEKIAKNEKLLNTRKDKITKLMKELDKEKLKIKEKETEWENEKKQLETTISTKDTQIEDLHRRESEVPSTSIHELQNELSKTKTELVETKCNFDNLLKDKNVLEENLAKLESTIKSETTSWKTKVSDLQSDLQVEKKKYDSYKTNHSSESRNKDSEISSLKTEIQTLKKNIDENKNKLTSVNNDYEDKLAKSQAQIKQIRKDYDDLTARYEVLEEEYVVTKAKLVMEKETINSQLQATREELSKIETDLQRVKNSYNREHDIWIQEKNSLGEEIKELKNKNSSSSTADSLTLERGRLKALLEEKTNEIEQLNNKYEVLEDQLTNVRKENEVLSQKLEDFDKVSKYRNITADGNEALENEVTKLKSKVKQVETNRKADLIECKLRYDTQIALVNRELQSVQNQVTKFKKERDAYKHMLDKTQKSLDDLQAAKNRNGDNQNPAGNYDDAEEHKMKMAVLEQQVNCLEDELSEARLERSKLKTELVSERSSWEVKLSEMQSKLNEMEEDRLISSGRITKTAGLRTRMELAWQREREEQTRLLQETSTLARDLRQTLFEVERERDKERLEAKRKQEQLRRTVDEEQEENRKKLNELQCDLLELRDAHAKLRTTNEKLRREKERNEKEREEFRAIANSKKKNDADYDRCLANLLEQIEVVFGKIPELQSKVYTPTPPRRTKSKSRESSPVNDLRRSSSREQISTNDNRPSDLNRSTENLQHLIFRLKDAAKELRQNRIQNLSISKWAASQDRGKSESRSMRGITPKLNRKSLSLEQTNEPMIQDSQIWKDNDSMSSMQSLGAGSDTDSRFYSMDSRLSGGSTQSEMVGSGDKKRKRGIIGKLKQLGKSRSIDDPSYNSASRAGSVTSDDYQEKEKKDLKERITGMFKRSGSSSRSNSVERSNKSKTDSPQFSSAQRPLMRNGRNGSGTSIN